MNGPGNVFISTGDAETLTIDAEKSILPRLRSEVIENILYIGLNQEGFPDRIEPEREINYYVTMCKVEKIAVSGSGFITASHIDAKNLEINVSGSGDLEVGHLSAGNVSAKVVGSGCIRVLSGQCEKAKISASGSGEAVITTLSANSLHANIDGSAYITIDGHTEQQKVTISGSGEYHAESLTSSKGIIDIVGSGKAVIRVKKHLDVTIDGSGEVCFYGQPDISERVAGSARLVSMDDTPEE